MMTEKVKDLSDQRLGVKLLLILLLLNGTLMLWAFYSIRDSRQGYEEKAKLTTQNMARMLDQSMSGSVAKIDLTLLSVVDELERQLRDRGHLDAAQSNAFLHTHQSRLAELSSLRVADATGLVILGEGVTGSAITSWGDRDFFPGSAARSQRHRHACHRPGNWPPSTKPGSSPWCAAITSLMAHLPVWCRPPSRCLTWATFFRPWMWVQRESPYCVTPI